MSPTEAKAETVHTMTFWYDGPRGGIADFQGIPHLYESLWDQKSFGGCWTDLFMLMPLDTKTFELAMEEWLIWRRWEQACHAGLATHEGKPALPEDRRRHEELQALLSGPLKMVPQQAYLKRGHFESRSSDSVGFGLAFRTVQWFHTNQTADGLLTYSDLLRSVE